MVGKIIRVLVRYHCFACGYEKRLPVWYTHKVGDPIQIPDDLHCPNDLSKLDIKGIRKEDILREQE